MTTIEVLSGAELKTDDTEPDLQLRLIDDNAVSADLSSSPEVNVYLKPAGADSLTVDDNTSGNVSIDDAANGVVSYSWQTGDLDTAATYIGEVEVVDGSDVTTYPGSSNFSVHVEEGLK